MKIEIMEYKVLQNTEILKARKTILLNVIKESH
jgi:hypothetical protein